MGHFHLRMPIDDRFDFFRMNFQPPDIDDAALATNKMIAVTAALDDIAGIDKPVEVSNRLFATDIAGCNSPRAEMQ